MGRPNHYSVEIASRCQRLIEAFADKIEADTSLVDEFGGPLRTTFLLAMSTPMIVLPMERLFKPLVWEKGGVADDSELDDVVGARVRDALGKDKPFGAADFFRPGAWAYVEAVDRFKVAHAWPDAALDKMAEIDAIRVAHQTQAATILICLRNALGHGGVAYLDASGRQNDAPTGMLAFAAFPSRSRTQELSLLRISVENYQSFLLAWAAWLAATGVKDALIEEGPGFFGAAA
jgi:hypothetical protein